MGRGRVHTWTSIPRSSSHANAVLHRDQIHRPCLAHRLVTRLEGDRRHAIVTRIAS